MGFINVLEDRGIDDILYEVVYSSPSYINKLVILNLLKDAVDNNLKSLLITDPDIDGFSSARGFADGFDILGYHNYEINPYNNRDHKLNLNGMNKAINGDYDLVIIFDTASSEIDKINKLVNSGLKVIILDHHRTPYIDYSIYPSNCYVINTTIENSIIGQEKYRFSAGALSFTIIDALLQMYNIRHNNLSAYALVSLYSDCMKISNLYNRSIYFMAASLEVLPEVIDQFMTPYTIFNRRFIVYRFNSKINALFRAERFDILNLMLTRGRLSLSQLNEINEVHEFSKKLVNILLDVCKEEKLGKIMYAEIQEDKLAMLPIDTSKAENYTGLVANRLSDICGLPYVVVCGNKGSLRDSGSRDMLSQFRKFSECGGHDSAFGIQVQDKNKFKQDIQIFCNTIKDVRRESIMLNYESISSDDIEDMAFYNEFSSSEFATAYIKVDTVGLDKVYDKFYSAYRWKDFTIKSPRDLTDSDRDICVRPELGQRIHLYYAEKI